MIFHQSSNVEPSELTHHSNDRHRSNRTKWYKEEIIVRSRIMSHFEECFKMTEPQGKFALDGISSNLL
jgi:hypothetical protein